MTDNELNVLLESGGLASFHFLININVKKSDETEQNIYICNNNEDITFNGQTYAAASFDFTPPKSNGSGAKLSSVLVADDSSILEELEDVQYNEIIRLEVYEVIVSGSEIKQINYYWTTRGSVTMTNEGALEFSPTADDRNNMTFPPYKFDTDNNRGNA